MLLGMAVSGETRDWISRLGCHLFPDPLLPHTFCEEKLRANDSIQKPEGVEVVVAEAALR